MAHLHSLAAAWIAATALFCLTLPSIGAAATHEQVLQHLTNAPAHPRLFWRGGSDEMKSKVQADPRLKSMWDAVRITADQMLSEPPVVYRKDGRRLLGRSREALSRTLHLGVAYRLTGERRYADRIAAEMEAMAAMPDWNPSHFLDVAEMTLAMAVGYDWLHDRLTPEQRASAREAIVTKGLGPYLNPGSKHSWERGRNNWNQVCHAGMVAGALALLEDDSERTATVVERALAGLPNAMKVYDPDGNYPEGPGYWNYGTTFNVMLVSMLESALGTDFGVSQSEGFLKTGQFPLHTLGPTFASFNFSDGGSGASFMPAMPWFAARARKPEWMWSQWELLESGVNRVRETKGKAQLDRIFPLALIWAEPQSKAEPPSELAWFARGENPIAIFRTSWTDPNATYLAVKAGTPSASHGHMDIGSFVLDSHGVRWSHDLGAQDYNALEQRGIGLWNGRQNGQRWQIFRYHNRAHSTLLVNDAEQIVTGKAPILDFSSEPGKFKATVDMSQAYAGQLARAVRRFSMLPDGRVTIEDELEAGTAPANVRWGMATRAKLTAEGRNKAWLEQSGKRLNFEVNAPTPVEIKAWPADKPVKDYDAPNPGMSIVGYELPLEPGKTAVVKTTLYCVPGK